MKKNLILLCSLLASFTLQPIQTNAQTVTNGQKLLYPYPFAPSEGLVNKTEKEHRQEICLNGYWDFQPVALPKDYKQGKGTAPELPLPERRRQLECDTHQSSFSMEYQLFRLS